MPFYNVTSFVPDLQRIAGYAGVERSRSFVAPNYNYSKNYKLLNYSILLHYPLFLSLFYYFLPPLSSLFSSTISLLFYHYFVALLFFTAPLLLTAPLIGATDLPTEPYSCKVRIGHTYCKSYPAY